jgi:hypothetical protein
MRPASSQHLAESITPPLMLLQRCYPGPEPFASELDQEVLHLAVT